MVSDIQAVIFPKKYFTKSQVHKIIKHMKLHELKGIRETKNFYRVRIIDSKRFKKFRIKKEGKIDLVIGFY